MRNILGCEAAVVETVWINCIIGLPLQTVQCGMGERSDSCITSVQISYKRVERSSEVTTPHFFTPALLPS